jgi:hypothetical protein
MEFCARFPCAFTTVEAQGNLTCDRVSRPDWVPTVCFRIRWL